MTATFSPTVRPVGPGTSARAWRAVLRNETRLFRREPVGPIWGFVLPVAAFVVLGLFAGLRKADPDLDGSSFLAVYQSVLPLLGAAMLGVAALPPVIAGYRERGVLRRYGVTPMQPRRVLGAQLAIHFTAALCTALTILVIGAVAFDTGPGSMTWAWLLTFLLAAPALIGLGLLIAAVTPSARTAAAVGTISFFPLMFGGGLWVPRQGMPDLMRSICDWSPLGAANRAMVATLAGDTPPPFALLALLGYAVVLWLLAVRLFRWS